MKTITILIMIAFLTSCSSHWPGFWAQQDIPKIRIMQPDRPDLPDISERLGVVDPFARPAPMAPPEVLQHYRSTIAAQSTGLLDMESDEPWLRVVDVKVTHVEKGDPTIVRAAILAEVSPLHPTWKYRHGDNHLVQYNGHFLFGPDGQFIRIRDAVLIDVLQA